MKKIILTGGGTAGHCIPLLSIVDDLKGVFDEVYYIGEKGGIEERLCQEQGITFYGITAVKLDRAKLVKNLKIPFKLWESVKQAKKLLLEIKPDIVFAKGGYVSLPTAIAAGILKIKLVIHESDMTLGLANKLCLPYANKVLTSYDTTYKKGICVGNPVRKEIFEGKTGTIYFGNDKKTILVMGGSSGSKTINELIKNAIDSLSDYNVIHIVGKSTVDIKGDNYYSIPFSERIQDLYAQADLVISRGGANALSELTALGKRAIIIPLPKGVSRGDQLENAKYYAEKGLVDVITEDNLTTENLVQAIENSFKKPKPIPTETEANRRIIEEIENMIL